jgi:lysophospholipase L1-like esterase
MLTKVVILADSLALPRVDVEDDIPYEATYPFLLEQRLRLRTETELPIIMERGMRRRTIEYVLDDWLEMVEQRRANLIIVHVGVVDCAPRIFLRRERQFIESMRWAWLRDSILSFVQKHRARIIRLRPRVYVPLERFERLAEQLAQKARQARVPLVFINIIEPPDEIEKRSPGFQQNVKQYNRVLESKVDGTEVQLIDLNSLISAGGGSKTLTVDGIHVNREGHLILAGELERLIKGYLRPRTAAVKLAECGSP